jgi:Ca-activated chloride channel homolog
MKFVLGILVMALLLTDLDKIGKINSLKSEAKKAYLGGDYATAVQKYRYLVDSLGVKEDEVLLNLANSYFELQDTTQLANAYAPLTQSKNSKIKSIANQQLGVAANKQGKSEEALNHFKQALKADPTNEDARFNYEIVKKKIEEQKKQEQQQNKDQKQDDQKKEDEKKDEKKDPQKDKKDEKKDQKDKQDKEQQDKDKKEQQEKEQKDKQSKEEKEKKEKEKQQKEQEQKDDKNKDKKDMPPSVSEKLKDMQMSEDKAKMILEAMKNQEVQYLQQNKRKATKPKDRGKPDW